MTEFTPGEGVPAGPQPTAVGAGLLTLGGLGAAFGLAACCALPLLLVSLGLSSAWLGGVASIAAPYRTLLLAFGALALAGGAVLLWRQRRYAATCGPEGKCTPPAVRLATLVGLIVGAVLLVAGYLYV